MKAINQIVQVERERVGMMAVAACIGVLLPFPFYYWVWNYPQTWVDLFGKGRDPSKLMALVSHLLKLLQFLSLFSVSSLSWPPPLYFWPLFLFGQFLNFRSGPPSLSPYYAFFFNYVKLYGKYMKTM